MSNIGSLKTTISAFTPNALVAIERLKLALDEYRAKPFSLDRRAKVNSIYGSKVIAIMRRYSELYPEFLVDKYFAFSFGDEKVFNPNQTKLVGLRITENAKGIIDTAAAANFIQVLLRVFQMEDTVFITPVRRVEFRGGEFYVSELSCITKYKIIDKNVFEFIKDEVKKMDERKKAIAK